MTKEKYGALGILILLVIAVYGKVITYEFLIYDDNKYILDNPFVWGGLSWEGAKWAFTTGYEANWHPVTWLSHMLDASLFGLKPGWHHAVNLLFHLTNTLLLLILLFRMTRNYWPSLLVAALFALHPQHVESVAWIAERKDVLCTFFLFLTLIAYYRYTLKPGYIRYSLALACYSMGLMAKPMLVSLPLILIIIDYWPLARLQPWPGTSTGFSKKLLLEKVPFAILAAASSVVTYTAQQSWGATESFIQQDFLLNLANAVVNYAQYLFRTVVPINLAVFYPFNSQISWWLFFVSLTVLVIISVTAVLFARKRPYILAGWLWYLITLLPVIGIVNIGFHSSADRYTYIPLIGVFVALAWLVSDALTDRTRAVWGVGVCMLLLLCSGISFNQVRFWKKDATLFSHAADVTSGNWLAHQHLAIALLKELRIAESYEQIQASIRLNPDNANNYFILADVYRTMGNPGEAIKVLEQGVLRNPNSARGLQNLGILYADVRRVQDAEKILIQLGRISPEYANNLEKHLRFVNSISGSGITQ